jgi:hypothetical protein
MHVIVNKLTLGKPIDAELLRKVEDDFCPLVRKVQGFVDLQLVSVSDSEAIVLAFFATREALDEVSSTIAGPWFAANVRPYLAGPVQRSVGEVAFRAAG